jgi:hypothetical protein
MVNVVQSTYSERIDKARAGMIGGSDFNTRTGVVETAAGIGFGLAVSQGAGDQGIILGGSAFVGITVRDVAVGAEGTKYNQYVNAGFLTRGQIWVTVVSAVVAGAAVHYDTSTGALDDSTGTAIPGARFVTSAGAGELALVELLANAGS